MFKPSEPHRPSRRMQQGAQAVAAWLLGATLGGAGVAQAGVAMAQAASTPEAAPMQAPATAVTATPSGRSAAKPAPLGQGRYQIRCWQYGRLLFEENEVQLPRNTAQYGVKLGGVDGHRRAVYIAETQNSTCLIRSEEDRDRPWPYTGSPSP